MKKIISQCFGCDISCINCGRKKIEVRICDDCRDEYAEYVVDGEDLCEDCLGERLKSELQEMLYYANKGRYLQTTAEQLGYNVERLS